MKFLSLTLLLFSFSAFASLEEKYLTERNRLLQLEFSQRYDALQASDVFDTSAPLGNYFYYTVLINTHQYDTPWPISSADLSTLKKRYPKSFLEYQILKIYADQPSEESIAQLLEYRDVANQNNWSRIERWATAAIVELEISRGNYGHVLFRIFEIIEQATDVKQYQVGYDYPLIALYKDIATSLYFLKDYEQSIHYCQKYQNYLPNDITVQLDGALCKVRAQLKTNQNRDALKTAARVLETAREHDQLTMFFAAYFFTAQSHLQLGNVKEAQAYALEALEIAESKRYKIPGDFSYLYTILAKANLHFGDIQQATHFLEQAKTEMEGYANSPNQAKRLLQIEADLAIAKNEPDTAAKIYAQLYEQEKNEKTPLPWADIQKLTTSLDNQQLTYLKLQAELDSSRTVWLTSSLAALAVMLCLGGLLYLKTIREKRRLEQDSQIDHETGINHRRYALSLISAQLKRKKCGSIALIEIVGLYGHPEYEKHLVFVAKLMQSLLPAESIIGRYNGNTFLVFIDSSDTDVVYDVLSQLRQAVSAQITERTAPQATTSINITSSTLSTKSKLSKALSACEEDLAELQEA